MLAGFLADCYQLYGDYVYFAAGFGFEKVSEAKFPAATTWEVKRLPQVKLTAFGIRLWLVDMQPIAFRLAGIKPINGFGFQ